jgi:hypothetical protein
VIALLLGLAAVTKRQAAMATRMSAVQSHEGSAVLVRAASTSNVTGETESRALHIRGFK